MVCNPFRPKWVREGQYFYIKEKSGSGTYWAVYHCEKDDDVMIHRWADVDSSAKSNAQVMVNKLNGWYDRDKHHEEDEPWLFFKVYVLVHLWVYSLDLLQICSVRRTTQ